MSNYDYKNEYVVYRVSGRVEDKYCASPIIGGNRMALVCSQTVVLMQIKIASLHLKYLCEICPVLPYYCSLASQILSLPTDICKLRVWLVRL